MPATRGRCQYFLSLFSLAASYLICSIENLGESHFVPVFFDTRSLQRVTGGAGHFIRPLRSASTRVLGMPVHGSRGEGEGLRGVVVHWEFGLNLAGVATQLQGSG